MRVETAERELEWAQYKLTSLWKFEVERLSLLQDKTDLARKVRRLESELLALAKRQIVAERQIATKTNANTEEVSWMQSRIAEAETKAFEAAAREEEARLVVDGVEAEAEEAANDLVEAEEETEELKRQLKWAAQREDRLRQKNENLQGRLSSYGRIPGGTPNVHYFHSPFRCTEVSRKFCPVILLLEKNQRSNDEPWPDDTSALWNQARTRREGSDSAARGYVFGRIYSRNVPRGHSGLSLHTL